MSEQRERFVSLLTRFKGKIQSIPTQIEKANNKVDFSSGRSQEIMIDIESLTEDLDNAFYLFCEEVEKLIK